MSGQTPKSPLVYTIGHSTRPLEEFIRILLDFGVTLVADVRTVPRSRHNPQFNKETLPQDLGPAGLGYIHLPGLGGLRKTRPDSPNQGWRSPAFRGFADYMQTPEFEAQLSGLLELARNQPTAAMCAEAVPWRCHRSLIADALTVREVRVEHILGLGKSQPHRLTPFARVAGTRLSYPPEENPGTPG
ncbi:MAG: DUF488 family protein [Desulfobaccales bacterium]